jgi:hypothetical protein
LDQPSATGAPFGSNVTPINTPPPAMPSQPASEDGWKVKRQDPALSQQARDVAKTAGQAVSEQAGELARDIGSELSKTAESQKARGVDAMRTFAKAMTSAAGELESQSPAVATTVRATAQRVEEFSANLRNQNVEELLRSATDVARSQPALFFAGAMVAGFALSRFLKSSSSRAPSEPAAPETTNTGAFPAGVE